MCSTNWLFRDFSENIRSVVACTRRIPFPWTPFAKLKVGNYPAVCLFALHLCIWVCCTPHKHPRVQFLYVKLYVELQERAKICSFVASRRHLCQAWKQAVRQAGKHKLCTDFKSHVSFRNMSDFFFTLLRHQRRGWIGRECPTQNRIPPNAARQQFFSILVSQLGPSELKSPPTWPNRVTRWMSSYTIHASTHPRVSLSYPTLRHTMTDSTKQRKLPTFWYCCVKIVPHACINPRRSVFSSVECQTTEMAMKSNGHFTCAKSYQVKCWSSFSNR